MNQEIFIRPSEEKKISYSDMGILVVSEYFKKSDGHWKVKLPLLSTMEEVEATRESAQIN